MERPKVPLRRRLLLPVVLPLGRRLLGPGQKMRASQFKAVGVAPGHVVFLGDSITEFGLWHEWFPDVPVLNRGIGGEISRQVLDRIDTAVNEPIAVFILIGTNDLMCLVDPDEIAANVAAIVREIDARAPGVPIVVQSVMPRAASFQDEVKALNERYRAIVAESTAQVEYLDLWPALATAEGALNPEFSLDKLHLGGEGYRAWIETIRPLVERFWTQR